MFIILNVKSGMHNTILKLICYNIMPVKYIYFEIRKSKIGTSDLADLLYWNANSYI